MSITETTYPTRPLFVGILENGDPIYNFILSDLIQVTGLTHLIKTYFVAYNLRKFTLINKDGTLQLLKQGSFEVTDIGSEFYERKINDHMVTVTLFDYKNNQIRKQSIRTGQRAEVMIQELHKLLHDLPG
jgi:hypothetical protein